MDRLDIVNEIQRTANENGGRPLGRQRFYRETGIKEADWLGRYWARWGDALNEAGFEKNELQSALPAEFLLESYASFARELGRLPVEAELRMRARGDKSFPSHGAFARLGSKQKRAGRLREYCSQRPGYEDIVRMCDAVESPHRRERQESTEVDSGFVYLIRSGHYFKIGRTNAVRRRERELALQLPERADTVHVIRTDDPVGIEAYWHARFGSKRKNGEWFDLATSDVNAFKRRKFM